MKKTANMILSISFLVALGTLFASCKACNENTRYNYDKIDYPPPGNKA